MRFLGGWMNGTRPIPAPSLRELSSECETEGVYYDARNRSKISEPIKTVRKPSARNNHRTTLPQSALRAASSLREGAGMGFHHSSDYSLKSYVTGDFHRPYEALMSLGFTVQWWGTRVYPKLSFSPWETLWHRSRKVSWLMVATEEGSCTGPVAMVPFSPGRVPPAREAAHRSRAYRAA